jgi:flagellar motility protein MotE (MotC chaperone)
MDVSGLAGFGATAIISAIASDAWTWMREEIVRVLAREEIRAVEVQGRLETFAADLSSSAERDVHNRLQGYLEAKLGDDPDLYDDFFALIRKISVELRLDPPALTVQGVVASNSVVVQTLGGAATVHVNQPLRPVIRWLTMTGPEAARKLESMDLLDAVEALADMEPALAARRLTHVGEDRARQLLSHMDEGVAAELLQKMTKDGHGAALLAGMEPSQAAAVLDMTLADWAVAQLAEMDPTRALALLAAMGSKRTDDLLSAMERQQAVILLSAVGKLLSVQNRVRTTFDLAEQEAERIAASARQEAQETLDRANVEAASLRAEAVRDAAAARAPDPERAEPGPNRAYLPAHGVPRPGAGVHRPHGEHAQLEPTRLADDFFLLSHNAQGRSRIHQTILETIIGGAVLCDLVGYGVVDIIDGRLRTGGGGSTSHPAQDFTLRSIEDHPDQSIPDWLRDSRKEVFLLVAQALAEMRMVVPVVKRWSPRGSGVIYKPTDESTANAAATHVVWCVLGTRAPDQRAYTLAALIACAELYHVLPVDLRPRQVRDMVKQLLANWPPDSATAAIFNGMEIAIASFTMAPRAR